MIPVVMPHLGETVTEATLVRWYRQPGELVQANDPLFDVETEKSVTDVAAAVSGVLADVRVEEGASVAVGSTLACVFPVRARRSANSPAARRLSPVVRRLLAEHGLNEANVAGTGPQGRITREDILAAVERANSATHDAAKP